MKYIFLPALLLATTLAFGQTTKETKFDEPGQPVFTFVERMPEFPGMTEYLKANMHYPKEAQRNEIQGVVYTQFIVKPDGSVADAMVAKGIGYGCDEEAVRVVNKMPRWIPGRQGGKPVPVRISLPIRFKLSEPKPKAADTTHAPTAPR